MEATIEVVAEARIKEFRDNASLLRDIISSLRKIGDDIEKAHKQGIETVYDNLFETTLKEFSKLVESFLKDKKFLDDETIEIFSTFIVYVEAYLNIE